MDPFLWKEHGFKIRREEFYLITKKFIIDDKTSNIDLGGRGPTSYIYLFCLN